MKIFISWSGERSRKIAEALRDWLPNVIQAVEPWMSSEDIAKGAQWARELTEELSETNFGIICLTPENLEAPWLLFEAGALSKTIKDANVSPFLFELKPADVSGPLAIYQFTQAIREDTVKLVNTLNEALKEDALPGGKVQIAFDKWWPDLENMVNSVPPIENEDDTEPRLEREILEEILGLVRSEIRESPPREYINPLKVNRISGISLSADQIKLIEMLSDNTVMDIAKRFDVDADRVVDEVTSLMGLFGVNSSKKLRLEAIKLGFIKE